MKNHFSKSKYCRLWRCPKILWMDKYKPEEKAEDATDDSRMEAGTEVGKLARELFGKSVDVTETVNGQLDLPAMIDRTQTEIEHETSVICEASFSYQGCYCAVDILKRENDRWAIYEVKSSTVNEKNMKAVYVADVAYQKYVLEHCGVRITGTYIVSINNDYVYDGKLDLPGGTIEFGERPEEALKRELMEEVGIEVVDYQLLDVDSVSFEWQFKPDVLIRVHHIGIFFNVLNYNNEIKRNLTVDDVNDDSLGAQFYDIKSLHRNQLSAIAILVLEKLGYKILD